MTDLYTASCSLLLAAESVLQSNGIPVPETSGVIYHEPVLLCGCDVLAVRPLGSFNNSEAITGNTDLQAFTAPLDGVACQVASYGATFEVHITRCVEVGDPRDTPCRDMGSCTAVLDCNADPPPMPADLCTRNPVDKATETYWLMNERYVLETQLAVMWAKSLCEGLCGAGCGEDRAGLGYNPRAQWVSTEPYDSGSCSGSLLTMSLVVP